MNPHDGFRIGRGPSEAKSEDFAMSCALTNRKTPVLVGLAGLAVGLLAPCLCPAEPPQGARSGTAAARGKAPTAAALVDMYDSGPCIECHRGIYDAWQRSRHSRSLYGAGGTAEAIAEAVSQGLMKWPYSGVKSAEDVKVEHLMPCARCHLPQLADADDNVAREIVAAVLAWQAARKGGDPAAAEAAAAGLKSLNIGCVICHNRNAVVHRWTDGYPKAGEIYGHREGTHPAKGHEALRKSPIMGESILCGQCHGLGPALDLDNPTQCSTTYGSHLYAYRAAGGKETCQGCHMRRSGLGHDTGDRPGSAMGKGAVDIATETHGFFWRDGRQYLPRVIVDVTLTNKAGHSLPDSLSASHRLTLEVSARAPDGKLIYSQARTYRPIPQRLGRGDRMGRGPYETSGIVEDTSLLPNRPVREKFDFLLDLAAEAGGERPVAAEVTVTVFLRLEAADDVAGAGGTKWYEFSKVVTFDGGR